MILVIDDCCEERSTTLCYVMVKLYSIFELQRGELSIATHTFCVVHARHYNNDLPNLENCTIGTLAHQIGCS